MGNDVIFDRIVKFTSDIMELKKGLDGEDFNTVVTESLFRAAAGIGVNFSDAMYPLNKNDFVLKLQLALKKSSETEYWLRFIEGSAAEKKDDVSPLLKECIEIKKIFLVSVANAKKADGKSVEPKLPDTGLSGNNFPA